MNRESQTENSARETAWCRVLAVCARSLRRTHPVTVLLFLAVVLYGMLLVFFPVVFSRGPLRSHFHYGNKHCFSNNGFGWVPLVATFVGFLALVRRLGNRFRAVLVLLFMFIVVMQWSFSFTEGVSAERLSSTLVHPYYGHSEFVAIAYEETESLSVLRRYEDLCRDDPRFVFCKSKPPGQLSFYMLVMEGFRALHVESVFAWIAGVFGFCSRPPLTAFGAFATVVFSLFAGLPVFALGWLGKRLGGEDMGVCCALTFALCPSISLVTGMPVRIANFVSSSDASALMQPPPT